LALLPLGANVVVVGFLNRLAYQGHKQDLVVCAQHIQTDEDIEPILTENGVA